MQISIVKQLKDLGLPETRAKVYEALLELKKASALMIARKTGMLRTTVYENLIQLRKQNLVGESYEGNRRYFVIETPEALLKFIKQKEQIVKDLLPSLFEVFQEKSVKPKIRSFEGSEGMKKINDESIRANRERIIRAIGDYRTLREYLSERYTRNHIQRRVHAKVKNQLIITTQDREYYSRHQLFTPISNIRALRDVRFAPPEIHFDLFMENWDDHVAFLAEKSEGYSFIFESPSFANTFKSLFNFLWNISEPLK